MNVRAYRKMNLESNKVGVTCTISTWKSLQACLECGTPRGLQGLRKFCPQLNIFEKLTTHDVHYWYKWRYSFILRFVKIGFQFMGYDATYAGIAASIHFPEVQCQLVYGLHGFWSQFVLCTFSITCLLLYLRWELLSISLLRLQA